MIKVLRSMYDNTRQMVWDGSSLSEWFETLSVVRQGCVLSTILFAIFLDDIVAHLPAGIQFAGLTIKVLLFADDIVLFSESPQSLQLMINKLRNYCKMWNLTVNLDKSKIMIVRKKQTKLSAMEKWYYDGQVIEIVSEYKYLGVLLKPNMQMGCHLEKKLASAKSLINASWQKILKNADIPTSAKYRVYESVMRSVMCYSCQVWGYRSYEEVEKLQRFFIKKLFRLPANTPNYVLQLETGLPTLFIYTLKLHFEYIIKVLGYSANRIPLILTKYIFEKRVGWVSDWFWLARKCGCELNLQHTDMFVLKSQLYKIVEAFDLHQRNDCTQQAVSSINRVIYPELIFDLGQNNYFKDEFSLEAVSLICRARGDLLNLNGTPYNKTATSFCTLCNLNAKEDCFHFLAICPVLKEFRFMFFGMRTLSMEQSKEILNGINWESLYRYLKSASNYRLAITNEYA